jgi:hypothetical protein
MCTTWTEITTSHRRRRRRRRRLPWQSCHRLGRDTFVRPGDKHSKSSSSSSHKSGTTPLRHMQTKRQTCDDVVAFSGFLSSRVRMYLQPPHTQTAHRSCIATGRSSREAASGTWGTATRYPWLGPRGRWQPATPGRLTGPLPSPPTRRWASATRRDARDRRRRARCTAVAP